MSSPTVLPLKIQYSPEDPNSGNVWLERWTQLQVWAPGPLVVKSLVPKSQTKKRSFHAVEAEKGKLKRGIKKPPGGLNTGTSSSSRSTAENEKPKRTVRKPSTLGKELNENKSNQSSRKSTSAIKEGSSLEVKDEKLRTSLKKASVSNGVEKPARKSAEKKKKEIVDSVQKELPVVKVSASVVDDTPKEEEEEKVKDSPETVSKEADVEKDEKAPVLDNLEKDDKAEEEIQEPEVLIITSENGNVVSEDTKPSDRRASLPAKIEIQQQDDGLTTQSGRKIPSYMAPTASAKARVRGGQGSPRIGGQEKPEKNGTTRRHSLPHIANNDKLSAMSPRVHRLLIASAKGSINSDRSFSSSKDIGGKKKPLESFNLYSDFFFCLLTSFCSCLSQINRRKLNGNGEFVLRQWREQSRESSSDHLNCWTKLSNLFKHFNCFVSVCFQCVLLWFGVPESLTCSLKFYNKDALFSQTNRVFSK